MRVIRQVIICILQWRRKCSYAKVSVDPAMIPMDLADGWTIYSFAESHMRPAFKMCEKKSVKKCVCGYFVRQRLRATRLPAILPAPGSWSTCYQVLYSHRAMCARGLGNNL